MRCFYFRILAVILSVLASGNIYAQEDTTALRDMSIEDLLKVKVTTASKTLQEVGQAPAKVILITKEQIKTRGYQSLLDVIWDLPSVKVDDKMYSGSRNSVTIRGIQGQQNFFILLDGVRISSPTNEALPIMENYPVHLAEQIEVVYGPASALYGADAVSGVINIITKKLPGHKGLVVDATAAGGMYGYANGSLYLAKKLGENTSVYLSGQYMYDQQPDYSKLYSGDTLMSVRHYQEGTFNTMFGPMTPSTPFTKKYEAPMMAYNIYAGLRSGDFNLSVFRNYTRIPNSWGNNTHNAIFNKEVYMGQSVLSFNGTYKKTFGKLTSTTSLTGTQYELEPGTNYRNLYSGMEPVYKYSNTLAGKAEQQIDYAVNHKINLTGGVTYEEFSVVPQSADLEKPVDLSGPLEGIYPGTRAHYRPEGLHAEFYVVHYHNTGGYLQAQYAASRKFDLTLGARYDYNSRYGETFNPRMGVVYKASHKTTAKLLYGSAYLAPPPSTAYVTYGAFVTEDSGKTYSAPFLHLPNPGLGPQTSHNFEASVRHQFAPNVMMSIEGFYTVLNGLFTFGDDNMTTKRYNNMFQNIPVGYIEVFVNEGKQRNYGGSAQLNIKHNIGNVFFNTWASFTYTDGVRYDRSKNDYDAQLPFISPFMVRIGTEAKTGKFSCSPRLIIMGRQNINGIKDTTGNLIRLQTLPGYVLLNVAARYEISRKVSLFANVTNALDQRYRSVSFNMDLNKTNTDVLHGQPQEPFRVTGGLNVSF